MAVVIKKTPVAYDYHVSATAQDFLNAFTSFPLAEQPNIFRGLLQATVGIEVAPLEQVVLFRAKDEADANRIKDIIEKNSSRPSSRRIVFVPSDTRYGIVHKVGVEGKHVVDCTCEDYTNRVTVNPNHTCKHMRRVSTYPSRYGI